MLYLTLIQDPARDPSHGVLSSKKTANLALGKTLGILHTYGSVVLRGGESTKCPPIDAFPPRIHTSLC